MFKVQDQRAPYEMLIFFDSQSHKGNSVLRQDHVQNLKKRAQDKRFRSMDLASQVDQRRKQHNMEFQA